MAKDDQLNITVQQRGQIVSYTKKYGIENALRRFDISIFTLRRICLANGYSPKAQGYYGQKQKEKAEEEFNRLLPKNDEEYVKANMKRDTKRLRTYHNMISRRKYDIAKSSLRQVATPLDLHKLKRTVSKE